MEVINVLLLLMPGLTAVYSSKLLRFSRDSQESDYAWLFQAFLCNVPALTLTWGILWFGNTILDKLFSGYVAVCKLGSLTGLIRAFDSLFFILWYVAVSFVVGFIVGCLITNQQQKGSGIYSVINWIRRRQGKAEKSFSSSIWLKLFDNQNEPVIEIVRSDGHSYKGFLRHFSDGSDTKELTIDGFDVAETWHEYLTEIESVYYHLDSDTLIKIYNTEKFKKAVNKAIQEQHVD